MLLRRRQVPILYNALEATCAIQSLTSSKRPLTLLCVLFGPFLKQFVQKNKKLLLQGGWERKHYSTFYCKSALKSETPR